LWRPLFALDNKELYTGIDAEMLPIAAKFLTRIGNETGKLGMMQPYSTARIFNMTRHGLSLFRVWFCAGLVLATLVLVSSAAKQARGAEPIRLNPGYVSLLKLDQTISTIVIGNPDIVDATLQGRNAILLTAKKITGSAATNVIVLNPQDAEIFNATIVVSSQDGGKTEIHSKGKAGGLHEYWAYRCTPTCERVEDKLETFQRSASPAPVGSPTVVVPSAATEPSGSETSPNQAVPQY
jgi:Pilus formation protein N terminal region